MMMTTMAAMAQFFERLGHRVVQTQSSYWFDVYPHFYLSIPYHRLVDPSPEEVSRRFPRFHAGVRYFGPPQSRGQLSYALICRNRQYDLAALSSNTRSKIRRGLKNCQVERLEARYARAHGRATHDDTLERIRIRDPYPWEVYWHAVEASECVEVWGALMGKELAAYLVAVVVDGCCEIQVARSSNSALRFYPNNALLYTAVRDMLSRPEIEQVWFGVESLEGGTSIDQFKLSMGFDRSPIRQCVVPHPLLRFAVRNALVHRVSRGLGKWQPNNDFWRKLQGLSTYIDADRL